MEINIDAIASLPLSIQLPELDIKYWEMQGLSKIGSMLGFPLKTDKYTKQKSTLRYARLLVEMSLDGQFPDYIEFANEKGAKVIYEWLPLKCTQCNDENRMIIEENRESKHQYLHKIRTSLQKMQSQEEMLDQAGMVGFLETKVKDHNIVQVMGKVCANWQWEHNATMTERGRIILCWHPRKYHFNLILKTDQLIHGEAIHLSTNKKFYITLVYERNLEDQRLPLWGGDLISLAQSMEDPWWVEVTEGETSDFAACIKHCGLQEFQYEGAFFTWTNKTVWLRIDRAFHNELWHEGFAYTHCPKPRSTFQFCDIWIRDKDFKDMVKHSLFEDTPANSKQFETLFQQDPSNQELLIKEASSRDHYITINHSALLLIKQQSKAEWIGFGDECTRIFAARIMQRKALTSIFYIKDQHDQRVEGFEAVSRVMTIYYKRLLGEMDHHRTHVDQHVIELGHCLNIEQQIQLCLPFTDSNVKNVLFSFQLTNDQAQMAITVGSIKHLQRVKNRFKAYPREEYRVKDVTTGCFKMLENLIGQNWYGPELFFTDWDIMLQRDRMEAFITSLIKLKMRRKLRGLIQAMASVIIYHIWLAKNRMMFKNNVYPAQEILKEIKG
ncbi:hypothetical protein Cgig2_025305 [Carnegiea gigantea]|uniref:Uncharacterized protein n=1 Tax=Carnegiea gigantea TaxID=171969 RepID=A0A9Q1GM05_9CARY|nr:hypothetical protein Cgig2_025974 [Carnegiea gigantea]KAJ8425287.1 hypothetical protein Cgig2_025305 [Carnegiea gigantea]